jgi:hypothetical protein
VNWIRLGQDEFRRVSYDDGSAPSSNFLVVERSLVSQDEITPVVLLYLAPFSQLSHYN